MCNLYILSEDQGVAANDSDSSPPRSRGRGRFEKSRIRGVSRGQSEDARSTSSQGIDETESSSNVGGLLYFFFFNGHHTLCVYVCVCTSDAPKCNYIIAMYLLSC